MDLKNVELGMAEDLSKEIREEYGLPETGMIIMETKNPDLRNEIKKMPEGGIREYLLSIGEFKDIKMDF